jgi:hypothetical protein
MEQDNKKLCHGLVSISLLLLLDDFFSHPHVSFSLLGFPFTPLNKNFGK